MDTVVPLVPNGRFIEAYMVGLNDEMRRELAWRQYPFDQRATFFQNFWSESVGDVPTNDIPAIASWDAGERLGEHAVGQADQVVLLVRGELLRRYPSTIVSAVQALPALQPPTTARRLGTEEHFPIFRGAIDPGMAFFGFALTVKEATDADGWYFVIAEHPSEPRFGLEPAVVQAQPKVWNDLAWPQVAVLHNHATRALSAPLASLQESGEWGTNSAQQAYITLREPVRVAMHATALFGADNG